MRDQNRADWIAALDGDPVAGQRVNQRILLRANGSEFAQRRALEAQQVNQSTADGDAVILIGEDSAALTRLVIPNGKVAFVQEMNFDIQTTGGGDPLPDDLATKLLLTVNGEQLAALPEFALSEHPRGSAGLKYGALPLDIIVPPGGKLKLTSRANGTGATAFDLDVTLLIRFEPLWLALKAGLVDVQSP